MLNFLVWIVAPLAFFSGITRFFLFAICLLFSQSYWIGVLISEIFSNGYSTVVVERFISESLVYSFVGGLSLILPVYFFAPRFVEEKKSDIKSKIHTKLNVFSFFLIVFIIFLTLIIQFYGIDYVSQFSNFGDRLYFLGSSYSALHRIFINTTAILISLLLIYAIFINNYNYFFIASFFVILLLQAYIVGFDGSRREVVMPLLIFTIYAFTYKRHYSNAIMFYTLLLLNLMVYLFVLVLSEGRAYNVGWNSLNLEYFVNGKFYIALISDAFSPMSTLHVNTKIIEYINLNGIQGFSNYFSAFMNLLFPKFIYQEYLFGEPLVLKLHNELGWNGLDFGYLAEAIYSGSYFGVILMHFLFGMFVVYILKTFYKNKFYGTVFMFCLIFACLNSLRSDFMNILKAFTYPCLFLIVLNNIYLIFKRKRS